MKQISFDNPYSHFARWCARRYPAVQTEGVPMNAPQTKTLFILALIVLSLVLGAGSCYWATSQLNCLQGRCPASESKEDIAAGVRITLWSPNRVYKVGEVVRVHATLENVSDHPVVLESGDGEPAFDITYVEYANGETVYWSAQHPDLAETQYEVQPGEKFEIEWEAIPMTENAYIFDFHVWLRRPGLYSQLRTTLEIGYGSSYLK